MKRKQANGYNDNSDSKKEWHLVDNFNILFFFSTENVFLSLFIKMSCKFASHRPQFSYKYYDDAYIDDRKFTLAVGKLLIRNNDALYVVILIHSLFHKQCYF